MIRFVIVNGVVVDITTDDGPRFARRIMRHSGIRSTTAYEAPYETVEAAVANKLENSKPLAFEFYDHIPHVELAVL